MQQVQISDVVSQTSSTQLGGQNCTLNIYQKSTGLFIDVIKDGALIIGGVICQNQNRIVRDVYLGFIGDLEFYDTAGTDDPTTPGLGTRYVLLYLELADLGARG